MKLHRHVFVVVAVVTILIKENLCVPAIRPLSQGGIIFPEDNWDDCFLDEASSQPGTCKSLEECPEVLKKWDKENIYPKTCYFIKKEQFVCCPSVPTITTKKPTKETLTEMPSNINTDPVTFTKKPDNFKNETLTKRPSNIFLDNVNINRETPATRPSNIFLDNINTNSEAFKIPPKKPINIFLDNVNTNSEAFKIPSTKPSTTFLDNVNKNNETSKTPPTKASNIFLDNLTSVETTTKGSSIIISDIFNTDKPLNLKRRSDIECDLQNHYKVGDGKLSNPDEFPFMAALGWRSHNNNKIWYACGGVLISPRFVLTAAHCAKIEEENPSFVHLGDKNLTDSESVIKIKKIILHPGYNAFYNDIALIELEEDVNVPIACVWPLHELPTSRLITLSYGHIRFGGLQSNRILKTPLTAIDKTECQNFYKIEDKLKIMDILNDHLCAAVSKNVRNTCQGDTGDPLIMEFDKISYVVGITSIGLACADLPPPIYARVSSFIDWIEQIVWPEIDIRFDGK